MAKKDQGIGMEGGNEGSWPGYASANPRNRLDGKEESDSEMDYGRPSVTGLSVSRPRKFSFPRLIVVSSWPLNVIEAAVKHSEIGPLAITRRLSGYGRFFVFLLIQVTPERS